mgnify:FL=1
MRYMALILSLLIAFLLLMLCIQAMTWGDGTSVSILSGGFALMFVGVADHIRRQSNKD